jgi:hypothetical protein
MDLQRWIGAERAAVEAEGPGRRPAGRRWPAGSRRWRDTAPWRPRRLYRVRAWRRRKATRTIPAVTMPATITHVILTCPNAATGLPPRPAIPMPFPAPRRPAGRARTARGPR